MSDTIENITLAADVWVPLYQEPAVIAAGISVGDKINVTLIRGNVRLHTGPGKPENEAGFIPLEQGYTATNEVGSAGEWAISVGGAGLINLGASA